MLNELIKRFLSNRVETDSFELLRVLCVAFSIGTIIYQEKPLILLYVYNVGSVV